MPVVAADHFATLRVLGVGGMGEVFEAEDTPLRRRVALKRLHGSRQTSLDNQRSFLREACITGQLEHPGVVPVHALAVAADGGLFFVMKRVEGRTLRQIANGLSAGPIARDTLLDLVGVVLRACDAIGFAHARGLVHCDLKAGNVMVGDFGEVYVVDWGLARRVNVGTTDSVPVKVAGAWDVTDGTAQDVAGTPASMAPEQAEGEVERIGPRTDIFAVGAMLYEVLTGRAPYEADHLFASLYNAATGDRQPLADHPRGKTLPAELVRIIEKAMSNAVEERYANIEALTEDLRSFVRGDTPFPTTRFAAGAEIVRQGDMGTAAYRILQGECDVFVERAGVREYVRTMGTGELFGETAILSPGPRTASVVARTDVVAEVVTDEELERELEGLRPWLATVVRTLAERFREREA